MSRRNAPAPRHVARVGGGLRGVIFALIVAFLTIVLSTGVSSYIFAQTVITNFNTERNVVDTGIDTSVPATDDGELNVLLLGSDERPDDDPSDVAGARTDTMMWVHIPEGHNTVYVMSIMRDLWVDIPGYGLGKVNGAYDLGGYPLVIDTVEGLVGTEIDHLAIIDFEGFRGLTEALGGVEIVNERAFSAGQRAPSFYPEGTIRIEGTDALRYVRERKAFLDGDYQRVRNQQTFIQGVVDQLLSRDVLTNPATLGDVVSTISPYLTVDEGLDAQTMVGYGLSMGNISSDDIEIFTIPNAGPDMTTGGASIIRQDEVALQTMRDAISSGTLDQFVAELKAEEDPESSESPEPTTETH